MVSRSRAGGTFIRSEAENRKKSGLGGGLKLRKRGAILMFFELFDLELRVFQPGFTDLKQLGAVLKFSEQVGQRNIAGFHRLNGRFELCKSGLE